MIPMTPNCWTGGQPVPRGSDPGPRASGAALAIRGLAARMAHEEQHDDGLGGRSRSRREVSESWRWAERLVALPAWHVRALGLPDVLYDAIVEGRDVPSPIARKRALNRIDSLVRDLDDDVKGALERGIVEPPWEAEPSRVRARWMARLKADGDAAIDAILAEYPAADRQRLRQIVRGGKENSLARYLDELLAAS